MVLFFPAAAAPRRDSGPAFGEHPRFIEEKYGFGKFSGRRGAPGGPGRTPNPQ